MAQPKLSIEARRIRMIIVTLPIMAATSYVLYKRHVLGEPQRQLPKGLDSENSTIKLLDSERRN
ncbi:hypothetical protein BYT27DRAFT_7128009 [Phlegmacium glaucopus]|nr:hypothetical protein BYT27DRAFT_7128009 [Phlegmacium glaucopus]